MNLKQISIGVISVMTLFVASCQKSQTAKVEKSTEYPVIENVDYHFLKSLVNTSGNSSSKETPLAVITGSNSWTTSAAVPIPTISQFYYINTTASPLGSSYKRVNYYINVDNNTRNYMCAGVTGASNGKKIEMLFYHHIAPSAIYRKSQGHKECEFGGYKPCISIDIPAANPVPTHVICSTLQGGASSTQSDYAITIPNGWDGYFSFTTSVVSSISKAYYLDETPIGFSACP